MDAAASRLIAALHQVPFRLVLAATGGGATAIAQLLAVPGDSRTILEASVPYSGSALAESLGRQPEHACSRPTAQELAERTRERAVHLAPGEPAVGFGCTASLATDRPKRGEHRFHLAARTAVEVWTWSLVLEKGARSRAEEEALLAAAILNALAAVAGIGERVDLPLRSGEELEHGRQPAPGPAARFFRGELEVLHLEPDGRAAPCEARALLPGSFHPLHAGHWELAAAASRRLGIPVVFELTIDNADKPPLGPEEALRRASQFSWRAPVCLTRAATFARKAELFPGAVFVVGMDTALRIVDPRFYHGSDAEMEQALGRCRSLGCSFLAAGRLVGGVYETLEHHPVESRFADLFASLPECEFRRDLSSTELRGAWVIEDPLGVRSPRHP